MTQFSSGTLAKYYKGGPVGIMPGQSMFVSDETRVGVYDARSSFVRMLNIIFARNPVALERASAVELMDTATPYFEHLAWRQSPGSNQIQSTPPSTMWDYQVFSIMERNSLLVDPEFVGKILAGENPCVLVNGIGNQEGPQWSIYRAFIPAGGPTPDQIANHPNEVFRLAKGFDHHVATFHDRDLLTQGAEPIVKGSRVLVGGVQTTSGFWTIWEFVGPSTASDVDAAGFKLVQYQTYRTRDFWNFIDWYATGYSARIPPVVRYATAKARDAAENPIPKTTFVRVDDDGTGAWTWTAYSGGAWNVVARQNGTIEFSSKFYDDPTRPAIGLDPISASDLSNISIRDGNWEFQVLFNLLRDAPALTNLEVNELFFSMLHFVHAQQDQVTWAFKTSFLNVGGYNESLTQTPVQPIDNTQNLLSYLDEVKPYRVKTREFTRLVTPNMDQANVATSDFDFPVYYDPTTGKYRNLNLTNALDLQIITTQSPWKEWYANYQHPDSDPENYVANLWNPVRHFTIGLNFDRVDHMPLIAKEKFVYDSARPNPHGFVMLEIDTSIVDMRAEIVEVYVGELRLADAQFAVDVDNVTIDVTPNDGEIVTVIVKKNLTAGLAGDRIQRFYDPENAEAAEKNLKTLMGLNFKGNVIDGGSLADNALRDYDIDGNANGAVTDETINPQDRYFGFADPEIDAGRPQELVVVGSGESLKMVVSTNWNLGAPPQTFRKFDTSNIANATARLYFGDQFMQYNDGVAVFRDGVRAQETDYQVDLANNTVNVTLNGAYEVIVKTIGVSAYTSIEDLQEWTYVSGPATFALPKNLTTYVSNVTVDGEFLSPGQYTISNTTLTLGTPPTANARVVLLAQGQPSPGAPTGSKVYTQTLAYTGSQTWSLAHPTRPFTNEAVSTIVEVDGLRLIPLTDYNIASGSLHITKVLNSNAIISATTFTDKDQLGIDTVIVTASVNGSYTFDSPYGPDYIWMTFNGVLVDPTQPHPRAAPTDKVVYTQFRGAPLLPKGAWAIAMNRPGTDIMAPKEVGDYDARPLDTTLYDTGRVADSGVDLEGDRRSIYVIRPDAYEFVKWGAPDAVLVGNVTPTSNTITVLPNAVGEMPFSLPVEELISNNATVSLSGFDKVNDTKRTITKPGVIWINGERIEFFQYNVTNTTVVLGELRRGTHNTRICNEQRKVVSYGGNGSGVSFAIPGGIDELNSLTVSVFEPLTYANGQPIRSDNYTGYNVLVPKTNRLISGEIIDYAVELTAPNIVITFVKPPAAGSTIFLATTTTVLHLDGSPVHDGRRKLDIRPDRAFSGETHYS